MVVTKTFEHQGWTILVGKGAADNDVLTFEIADPGDLWLHVAGWSGSHVVVRIPPDAGAPPREVVEHAARLAAWHSKARGAKGKVDVHVCRVGDVRKPPRMAPGKVQLRQYTTVKVYAADPAAT